MKENSTNSQVSGEKMELILKGSVDMSKESIKEMTEKLNISWVNPRVDNTNYPYLDSFSGRWTVEVVRLHEKMKLEDIVHAVKNDGWQPASVHHLLAFLNSPDGQTLSESVMALGSLCLDDFEYPGCVVLNIEGTNRKLGLGNWRGSKISGYTVLRVRRE